MVVLALVLVLAPVACFTYAYLIYPAALRLLAARRPAATPPADPAEWPAITICVPAFNEERVIRGTIESLLALDYPPERRQILIMSDASTDATDRIVREFAGRGVELLRLPQRGGKTAAENAAAERIRGEIVVNTDASIRIRPDALKPLIRAFSSPMVAVASGRDVSVGRAGEEANEAESGYVGYEMWVRSLETRLDSIVGASGCFYAARADLFRVPLPTALTRDFALPLMARSRGSRSVSVSEAVCVVPRTPSLQAEFRRKIRTMAQGLQTLWYERALMNPLRYGGFAVMLVSHKLARWLVYLALPLALIGLALLGATSVVARVLLGAALAGIAAGVLGMRWPTGRRPPRLVALAGFALAAALAGVLAWRRALAGAGETTWEPTRR